VGRPSIFTAELAASICERIALGESLRAICRDEGMPGQTTVFEWLSQDASFAEQYARAIERRADTHAEAIIDIADEEPDPAKARVRVDARKWYASKMNAKKYGERQAIDLDARVESYVVRAPEPAKDAAEWLKSTDSGADHG
jgi:hypothetical protein